MFEGNWKCGSCGAAITKLPFEPTPGREGGLKCIDCFKKNSGGRGGQNRGPKEMHKGDWQCSKCGTKITELPFEPKNTDGLMCRDCFKTNRN